LWHVLPVFSVSTANIQYDLALFNFFLDVGLDLLDNLVVEIKSKAIVGFFHILSLYL